MQGLYGIWYSGGMGGVALPKIAVVLALLLVGGGAYYVHAQNTRPLEVRWLVAHQPTEVFDHARQIFSDELAKQTGRQVRLTFLIPKDFGYASEVPPGTALKLLQDGSIDLLTINIDSLLTKQTDLEVLHLPYLFKDYASADKVFSSKAGSTLLGDVGILTEEYALAFTYSGGFRIIATKDAPVTTPAAFNGLRITTWGDHLMQNNLSSLGATPAPVAIGAGQEQLDNGQSDGAEFTYTRSTNALGKDVRYISETNHVLFLSTILAGSSFFSSLSAAERVALKEAAATAAQTERKDSIAYGESVKQQLQKQGITIDTLSAGGRAAFEAWGATVRAQFAAAPSTPPSATALIQEILKAQQ